MITRNDIRIVLTNQVLSVRAMKIEATIDATEEVFVSDNLRHFCNDDLLDRESEVLKTRMILRIYGEVIEKLRDIQGQLRSDQPALHRKISDLIGQCLG